MFQSLNKVQLCGVIGSVREDKVGDKKCIRFSLATSYAYRDSGGFPVIDTTWSPITWFVDSETPVDFIRKGERVEVMGRIRNMNYINSEGADVRSYEILANQVLIVVD